MKRRNRVGRSYAVSVVLSSREMAAILHTMSKTKEQLTEEIERILETLRGGLAMHAGNVELVDVDCETGKVSVRLLGTCVGCPMADMTLKAGIEETIRELVPEITEVIAVP